MDNSERDWQYYLDEGYTVIIDNDSWWFYNYNSEDKEFPCEGGSGPYGVDLLKYLLDNHYNGMEWV